MNRNWPILNNEGKTVTRLKAVKTEIQWNVQKRLVELLGLTSPAGDKAKSCIGYKEGPMDGACGCNPRKIIDYKRKILHSGAFFVKTDRPNNIPSICLSERHMLPGSAQPRHYQEGVITISIFSEKFWKLAFNSNLQILVHSDRLN